MQIDAGFVLQIDIQDDAGGLLEGAMAEQSSGGFDILALKPCCCSNRFMLISMDASSSTTKTDFPVRGLLVGKMVGLLGQIARE
jgi:hypothetical protein